MEGLLNGIPVSEGIAIGTAWVVESAWDEVVPACVRHPEKEVERYLLVLETVGKQLRDYRERVEKEIGKEEARIFEAHLAILQDSFFHKKIPAEIIRTKRNAESVLKDETKGWIRKFLQKTKDEYLRLRAEDINDVAVHILNTLLQNEEVHPPSDKPTIIVAHSLNPSETSRLDKNAILGFATEMGGATSHASILARSMGIPAVVGVDRLKRKTKTGDTLVVDGHAGIVHVNPPKEVIESYRKRKRQFEVYRKMLTDEAMLPAVTKDGTDISVQANIASLADISMALRYDAQGIGLFRTELPFLTAGRLLSEEEQFTIYHAVAEAMKERLAYIRTLDLGGDKFLPFQSVEEESNPFMGWRSIRISLLEKDVFKAQLRAILRASASGNLGILFPMISSNEEIIQAKEVLEQCKEELRREGVVFKEDILIGIMVEVPSAAILAYQFAQQVDHLSIGTNDLIQYTLAVDRNNEKVAPFYQPLNPAIINLIYNTIQCADHAHKSVALCGEMAGNPLYTPLLLGLGLRQLSMSPLMLPEIKKRIRVLTLKECEKLRDKILALNSANEIEKVLWDFHNQLNKRLSLPFIYTSPVTEAKG